MTREQSQRLNRARYDPELIESRHEGPPGVNWWTENRPVGRFKGRTYYGENVGAHVTNWLNEPPEDPDYPVIWGRVFWDKKSAKRILTLLKDFVAILEMLKKLSPNFDWRWGQRPDPKNLPPEGFHELESKLNDQLRKYRIIPSFTATRGRQWVIENVVGDSPRPYGELVAAHSIIELAKLGLLSRIIKCDCGKWYFARFQHQRCCSDACRRKLYEKTPAFKKARREYMRQYYWLKKSGKVK
jgi:hypothetical protein